MPRNIPMASTAARILSAETLRGLEEFYASDALEVTTDKGQYDPSKQRAKWIKSVLKESPVIAEYLINRLVWHHNNETTNLRNWRDFQFITGLLQFDDPEAPALTREQEVALIRVTKVIYGAKNGGSGFTLNYGTDIVGTWMVNDDIGKYTINHPEHTDSICQIIRERGVIETADLNALLHATGHALLVGGSL